MWFFFFSSRRRHTRCALVTGVQTCALPISWRGRASFLAGRIQSLDSHIAFASLGLSPIAISIGPLDIRWYSLAYIAGIIAGWWYLLRLLAQSDAPMNRQQADDLVLYATLGVILGGRLGYVIFYGSAMILPPLQILQLLVGGLY